MLEHVCPGSRPPCPAAPPTGPGPGPGRHGTQAAWTPGPRPGHLSAPLSLSALPTVRVEGVSQTEPPVETWRHVEGTDRGPTATRVGLGEVSATHTGVRPSLGHLFCHVMVRALQGPLTSTYRRILPRQSSDGLNWLPQGGHTGQARWPGSRVRLSPARSGPEHGARPGGVCRRRWATALSTGAVSLKPDRAGPRHLAGPERLSRVSWRERGPVPLPQAFSQG